MVAMRFVRVIVPFLFCAAALFAADPTKLTVQVNSADTGKPIGRASVVVKFRHGLGVNMKKIVTNWETKTNEQGRVTLPSMPQGEVQIQIIAKGFQTFGDIYQLTQGEQTIEIKLNRPQTQYSEHAEQDRLKEQQAQQQGK
jgi:hypothetical protein